MKQQRIKCNSNGLAIVFLIMIINNSAAYYISEKPFRYHCREALKSICTDDIIIFSLSNQQYSMLFGRNARNSNLLDNGNNEKNGYNTVIKKLKLNVPKIDCCTTQCNYNELRQHCNAE